MTTRDLVLTVDVGLRNLAMCAMGVTENKLELHLWDVYDILNEDDNRCNVQTRKKKICGKKCNYSYTCQTGGQKIYTCKPHFPKEIGLSKSNVFTRKNVKDYDLQEIASVVIGKVTQVSHDNNQIFEKISTVLIELQPTINRKMIFVSHILYGKFVDMFSKSGVEIKFVRASEKLKVKYTGPELNCNLKTPYARRKWLSVEYTKWFLDNHLQPEHLERWKTHFMNKVTKPDMGDTFLMAVNALFPQDKLNYKKKFVKNPKSKSKSKPKPKTKTKNRKH
jgi:hypothetical protein